MNLYVSNLAYSLTDEELRNEFGAYGTVAHARIVLDRETQRSRGFGFVDMPNDDEARAAIENLNGAQISGRAMRVVEARPREERPARPPGPPKERSGGGGGDDRRPPRGGNPKGGPRREQRTNWNDNGDDWDDRRRSGGGGGGGGGRKDRGSSRGGRPQQNWESDFED
ncbi:MAG: RNA-binding protein [Verrucomicrobiales bacterium]|nr:RNA-binding protein [Verrucomicrobiales bacterium]